MSEANFGNRDQAKERARAALELGKGRDVEYTAAFALALSGESAESRRLAGDLEKRFPEDTPVQFEYLPTLGALLALSQKAPLEAIERLQTALPSTWQCRAPRSSRGSEGCIRLMCAATPTWRHDWAARRLQNSKRSSTIVASFLLIRSAAWRTCNQDFLTLWKDADADLPILKQAKAEYVRLR